ncbi:MAG: hypothetical protein QM755_02405 [Luteolibacter sp.]
MNHAFYGAQITATEVASDLLGISRDSYDQDWEIEVANPGRIGDIMPLLEGSGLDFEVQSALALLLVSCMIEAHVEGSLDPQQISRAIAIWPKMPDVLERMKFFYLHLKMTDEVDFVKHLLGVSDHSG